eukprot:1616591-Rhodomonas_salina.1
MSTSTQSDSEFETEIDDEITDCLLSQCQGCAECQADQALQADLRIEDLKAAVAAAEEEIKHLREVKKLFCLHRWRITADGL